MTTALDLDRIAWDTCLAEFVPKPSPPRRWASPLDMACDLDTTIVRTPALEVINAAIVDLIDGRTPGNRLAVFMPPQEGKSTLCSKWTPLWVLVCVNPDLRIIDISYAAEHARFWGGEVKNALEAHNGDEGTVDLELRLRPDSRSAGRWHINKHRGGIYCAGVNGAITGKPGDGILVDDPIKGMKEAQSETVRKNTMSVYRGSIVPRCAPKTWILWVQTLWHEDEPIAQITANEAGRWRIVRIPAICDSPDDPLGRRIGEPMVSARGDRDWDVTRKAVGEYVFAAEYQQHPAPVQGGLFKRIWWRYWTRTPGFDAAGERLSLAGRTVALADCWRFITGDLAASTKTSADWTVASAWALTPFGDLVLLDRTRGRVGEEEHFDLFRPLAQRWQVDTIFLEKSQHSTTLVVEATKSGLHVTPLDADADKFTRALPASKWASNGNLWLPAGALWLDGPDGWVTEHANFPNGSHDDQVDTCGYAVRVAVTKWAPPPPPATPPIQQTPTEIDFMSVPM